MKNQPVVKKFEECGEIVGSNFHRILDIGTWKKKRNLMKVVVSVYLAIIQATLLHASETWMSQGSTFLQQLEVETFLSYP